MAIRRPSRSDSSRTSAIPATLLVTRTSSIFLTKTALLISQGISVTTICCLPPLSCSISVLERTTTRPLPVSWAFLISSRPWIMAPVEIRPRQKLHELVYLGRWMVDHVDHGIDDFSKVVAEYLSHNQLKSLLPR